MALADAVPGDCPAPCKPRFPWHRVPVLSSHNPGWSMAALSKAFPKTLQQFCNA